MPAGGVGAPTRAVVVVAAGSGTRLAQGRPKAFVEVAGRTILEWSLRPILLSPAPWQVVVVVPSDLVDEAAALLGSSGNGFVTVVAGSATRQGSVARGLAAVGPRVTTVLVHDSARCFTPTAQFEAVASGVEALGHGVVPGLPVSDTIKRVDAEGAVVATVDRSELVAMQTPQGFPRAELDAAYAAADDEHTDDAALYEAAGHRVTVVDGHAEAFKITTPWDLSRAAMLAAEGTASPTALRTGVGIDVHAFDPAEPLRLGTLDWPGEQGLAGHSDGDAVAHAIVDALLSAAGQGDIGSRFGTDDPRYAGASGVVFLEATRRILTDAGARIANVAVQVIGNRPRLAARRTELEEALAILVGAPVSVSATTTDGLGFTGRGEGVTVIATALVSVASD
ncbi:bifunctional enzyme IspD/IspF [Frondihabitans sucicola]|uniref:Bifunctional enzyme IspD/IspF n=1 Tax=Frondihabitans sucicola TaxID=1268041 RepID=A0ABM8GLG8_9MICO|nr:2-C-methyl-D-erythritol 4-phosphate cytidylyltransferase [Frondihabitans sucicola]BDZ49262.1 bifunctional enzyme IspD/IspF [Frondihabitans sucicola]